MKVKELKSEGLSHELEVTVPAEEIERRMEKKLQEYAKTIRLPGFRPGKVPLAVMKQRYGTSVRGEVLEKAVNDSTQKALKDKKLQPAMQPKIEITKFELDSDLVFKMQVEVMPTFQLVKPHTITLERLTTKASDKNIDEAIQRIAQNNRETAPISGNRASKKGDILLIDFHGRTKADNKEREGMHAHDHELELGSGQFIAGFEDQLIGKKAGDKVEVEVTFPDPYVSQDLAGQVAIFDVDIKEIREAKDTEVNDEFAKKLGLDNLQALRDAISKQLQSEYDNVSRMKLKRALLDLLDDVHEFDVPERMKEIEFNGVKNQVAMGRQDQLDDKGQLQLSAEEEEELRAIADRRIRLGMILSAIGRENNIEVNDQEIQKAVVMEAQKYPGQEAQVFEYYRSNPEALNALRAPVFEDKVVDFIIEMAKVKDKEVSEEDLMADDDDESYLAQKKAKKGAAKKSSSKKSDDKKEEKSDKAEAKEEKPAAKKKAPAKKKAAKKD